MFNTYYGTYRTNSFSDIFPSLASFKTAYNESGFTEAFTDDEKARMYTLLYGKYGNEHIFSSDENRFKARFFSILSEYGPEYCKKYSLQQALRNLSEDELRAGTISIYNRATNPSTLPLTNNFEPLKKIDDQTATGYKKSKLEAFQLQAELLNSNYAEAFLSKFQNLFNPFTPPYPFIVRIDAEDSEKENN